MFYAVCQPDLVVSGGVAHLCWLSCQLEVHKLSVYGCQTVTGKAIACLSMQVARSGRHTAKGMFTCLKFYMSQSPACSSCGTLAGAWNRLSGNLLPPSCGVASSVPPHPPRLTLTLQVAGVEALEGVLGSRLCCISAGTHSVDGNVQAHEGIMRPSRF
jgi:hypothetical protein